MADDEDGDRRLSGGRPQIQEERRSLPLGVISLPPGSRGPRSLYLRRQESGFGFTLRHFIVYPPEDEYAQPMDTIFVRGVVEGGAGALAGLRQGDRIVSVNNQNISGLSYAQVVHLIKRSPPYLHLLVVEQQDDILQKYFSTTAHHPETNRQIAQPQVPVGAQPQIMSPPPRDDAMSRFRINFEKKQAFLTDKPFYHQRPHKFPAAWPPPPDTSSDTEMDDDLLFHPKAGLSRIHENIPSTVTNFRADSVVLKRTRQFESGRSIPDDDDDDDSATSDRSYFTNELARLSTKVVVPNVACRKREFEIRSEVLNRELHRERDNLRRVEHRGRSNSTGEVKGRVLTNETLEWYATQNMKQRQQEAAEVAAAERHKAVRQNSYLTAVRGPSVKPAEPQPPVVIKRTNLSIIGDEERVTRRTSYLKATLGDDEDDDVNDETNTADSKPQLLRSCSSRSCSPSGASGGATSEVDSTNSILDKENCSILKDGVLHCKVTLQDGKRATDRSWKQTWAVLNKQSELILYNYRHQQSPISDTDLITPPLDVRYSTITTDYTKRKNVFRLSLQQNSTEILLQTDDPHWISTIQQQQQQQVAVPQQVPAATSILVQGGTRWPWGRRVVRQFRSKIGSAGNVAGGTIGVPLEMCPQSSATYCVPLLVEVCCGIVEERGLDVIGIYRVPGNTAAITLLTDEVNNRGIKLQDPKWRDVNVVSSLLKLFFRRLPDSLFTNTLYSRFIDCDKLESPHLRLEELRKLLRCELPECHYETLKYLMFHLKKVVQHSHVNKMEARNLAIVFGPTLVRAGDDNMVTMVTDMQHQCKIIESLLIYVDWFFSDDDMLLPPTVVAIEASDNDTTSLTTNHSLLLNNIDKIVGKTSITSNIISAAHRKIQKKSKQPPPPPSLTPTPTQNKQSIESIPTTVTDLENNQQQQQKYRPMFDITNGTIRSYAGLSATTQERIRKFEQETRAMLTRQPQPTTTTTASLKRLKTGKELVSGSNQLQQRCGSLDSLDRVERNTDLSDDGSDLLTSLTSTFDRKLKNLLTSDEEEEEEEEETTRKIENIPYFDESDLEIELSDFKLFRNPSLHKKSDRKEKEKEKAEEEDIPDNDRIIRKKKLLHRVDSLTKNEKTECNINKKREWAKRKSGIKRRHTVGGTKDFVTIEQHCCRASSPDLTRRERFLLEVNDGMIVGLRKVRPHSLPETRVFKVPLESHV